MSGMSLGHWYRDVFTTRPSAERQLLAADLLVIGSTLSFAAGAWRPRGGVADVTLVVLWAVLPRALEPIFRALRNRRSTRELGPLVATGVIAAAFLAAVGFDLLSSVPIAEHRPHGATLCVVILAWAATFFLSAPIWYLISDVLLTGALLLGLVERQPLPGLAVVAYFSGMGISLTTRHLLHGIHAGLPGARMNLQNARVAGLGGACIASLLFGFITLAVASITPAPRASRGVLAENARASRAARLTALLDGSETEGAGIDGVEIDEHGAEDSRGADRAAPRAGASKPAPDRAGDPADGDGGAASAAAVGFTDSVELAELGPSVGDRTVALEVHPPVRPGEALPWAPRARTLWRAAAYARCRRGGQLWEREGDDLAMRWPPATTVLGAFPSAPRAETTSVEIRVLTDGVTGLVSPYFGASWGPVTTGSSSAYRRTRTGDVLPVPPLAVGDRYRVTFTPVAVLEKAIWTAAVVATGAHPDPVYLELPPNSELGMDLRRAAERVVGREGSIGEKLERLRGHFAGSFSYGFGEGPTGERQIARFLQEQRAGDCNHFAAAAALLLRAVGVSTRVASGFTGGEWHADRRRWLLRNESAHAWIEVYVPGGGWFPADPSTWVRVQRPSPGSGGGALPGLPRTAAAEEPATPGGFPAGSDGGAGGAAPDPPRDDDALAGDLGSLREDGVREDRPTRPAGEESDPDDDEAAAAGSLVASGAPRVRPSTASERDVADPLPPRGDPSRPLSPYAWRPRASGPDTPLAGVPELGLDRSPPADRSGADAPASASSAILRLALIVFGGIVLLALVAVQLRPPAADEAAEEAPPPWALVPLGDEADPLLPQELLAEPRWGVLREYHLLQRDLRISRRQRRSEETPRSHGERCASIAPRIRDAVRELVGLVYQSLYGATAPDGAELERARECAQRIRRRLS